MFRHLGVFIGLAAGFVSSLGFAQNDPPNLIASPPGHPSRLPDQDVIESVKSIRQRLGGGIAEQFKDLGIEGSSAKEAELEFERELTRLATQVAGQWWNQPSISIPPISNSRANIPAWASHQDAGFPGQPARPQGGPPQNGPPHGGPPRFGHPGPPTNAFPGIMPFRTFVPNHGSANQLRNVARRLDSMAAELESANLYSEADEIRDQARKFWMKARGLKNNSN